MLAGSCTPSFQATNTNKHTCFMDCCGCDSQCDVKGGRQTVQNDCGTVSGAVDAAPAAAEGGGGCSHTHCDAASLQIVLTQLPAASTSAQHMMSVLLLHSCIESLMHWLACTRFSAELRITWTHLVIVQV